MTFLHAATWAFVSLISGLAAGYWWGYNKVAHEGKVDAFARRLVDRLRNK